MSIDKIYIALTALQRAQSAHDEAMGEYRGYSWGYYGQSYFMAIEAAQGDLKAALDQYIDERIAAAKQPT